MFKLLVVIAVFLAFAQCATISDRKAALQTLCGKYTAATGFTAVALMNKLLNDTVYNIIAQPDLVGYFTGDNTGLCVGQCPDHTGDLSAFITRLATFFGNAIGCQIADSNFPASTYDPYTIPSMTTVHQNMKLTKPVLSNFITQAANAFSSNGVTSDDLTLIGGYLQNFGLAQFNYTDGRNSTCNQQTSDATTTCPSICDFYATALGISQTQTMTAIVTGAFGKITTPGNINQRYFTAVNGSPPFNPDSADFVNDQTQQSALVTKLVNFFGQPSLLACTGFTQSVDINAPLHQKMYLSLGDSMQFNADVGAAAAAAGVDPVDLATVTAALQSFQNDIVYQGSTTGPSATNAPATNSSSTLVASLFIVLSAVAVLLF